MFLWLRRLLVVAPFFVLGIASGHDFEFHAASWLDVAGQWKEGIIFPRWAEWANHGFGEPRFIFYPPLSWLLGAALGSVLPWNAVPVVFIVLVQTLAGLCAFALARNVTSRRGALFGAACYAANPYALLVVYMRSDFAEQLGAAFFPLLILLALRVGGILRGADTFEPASSAARIEIDWRSVSRNVAWFSVVFAAMWLSNAPAGVMASYSAALLFAWGVLQQRSWRPAIRGAAGLALGFGLTAFYLVPAAYEQRWVNIEQALASGLQPAQNFLYTMTDDPEHTLFNWIASSVAILLIVITGVAAVLTRRKFARAVPQGLKPSGSQGSNVGAEAPTPNGQISNGPIYGRPSIEAAVPNDAISNDSIGEPAIPKDPMFEAAIPPTVVVPDAANSEWGAEAWSAMLVLAGVATLLMLRFTNIFWRVLPKLRFVQFPWRWMCALAVCYAFFLAWAFGRMRRGWILAATIALCCVGTAAVLVQTGWWDTEDLPTLQAGIAQQSGFDGTDEYDPAGDDHYNIPASAPQAQMLFDDAQKEKLPDTRIVIRRWSAEDKELTVKSSEDVRLGLRLLNYPAWQVEVNGKVVTPERGEEIAQMVLPLQAGTSQIRVRFARTADRTLGAGISLVSLLLLIPLFLSERYGTKAGDPLA